MLRIHNMKDDPDDHNYYLKAFGNKLFIFLKEKYGFCESIHCLADRSVSVSDYKMGKKPKPFFKEKQHKGHPIWVKQDRFVLQQNGLCLIE